MLRSMLSTQPSALLQLLKFSEELGAPDRLGRKRHAGTLFVFFPSAPTSTRQHGSPCPRAEPLPRKYSERFCFSKQQ